MKSRSVLDSGSGRGIDREGYHTVEGNHFLRLRLVLKVSVTWRRSRVVMLLVAKSEQSDPLSLAYHNAVTIHHPAPTHVMSLSLGTLCCHS